MRRCCAEASSRGRARVRAWQSAPSAPKRAKREQMPRQGCFCAVLAGAWRVAGRVRAGRGGRPTRISASSPSGVDGRGARRGLLDACERQRRIRLGIARKARVIHRVLRDRRYVALDACREQVLLHAHTSPSSSSSSGVAGWAVRASAGPVARHRHGGAANGQRRRGDNSGSPRRRGAVATSHRIASPRRLASRAVATADYHASAFGATLTSASGAATPRRYTRRVRATRVYRT